MFFRRVPGGCTTISIPPSRMSSACTSSMAARPPPKRVWNVNSKFLQTCSKVSWNCFCEVWLISSIAAIELGPRPGEVLALVLQEVVALLELRVLLDGHQVDGAHGPHPLPQRVHLGPDRLPVRRLERREVGLRGILRAPLPLAPHDGPGVLFLVEVEGPQAGRLVVGAPKRLLPPDRLDVGLELACDLLGEEDGALAALGQLDLVGAQLLMRRVGLLPERGLGRLEGRDLPLDIDEPGPDLLHLLLGDGKGLPDPLGIRLLVPLLLLEVRDLCRPRLDLLLALEEKLADLPAAALHLAEPPVDHLHLLAAFGELEARLRERLALQFALRPRRGQAALQVLDAPAVPRGRRLGPCEIGRSLLPAGLRLEPGVLQGGELALHALRPRR